MSWIVKCGLVVLTPFLLDGCDDGLEAPDFDGQASAYTYHVPAVIDDGWTTASPGTVGIDSLRLVSLMTRLARNRPHRVHAILLIRHGVLVFEEYFAGDRYVSPGVGEPILFTRETKHYQASVTKSVTSALVGTARDRGLLELETPVLSYFARLSDLNTAGREEITLEDLITMRSGLPWDESSTSYTDPANDVVQLFYNPDPIRYILGKEMEAPAGTLFCYNSGATNVLGKVVDLVTGRRLDHFAADVLFQPLGIADVEWELINDDLVFASGGLYLRPRDMAKLGELYLREGEWEGEEILSSSWIAASRVRRSVVAYGWADGYGYGWWTRTYSTASGPVESYFAAGWGEQQIVVVPELDLVAVFTGGSYEDAPYLSPGEMMADYVLPAVSR